MKTNYVTAQAKSGGAKFLCEPGTGHQLICFYPEELRQFVMGETLTVQADLMREIFVAAGGTSEAAITKDRLIDHISDLVARANAGAAK